MSSLLNILLYVCFFPLLMCIVITIRAIYDKIKCLILKKEFKHDMPFSELLDYKKHPIILTLIFLLCLFYTLFSNPVFTNVIGYYDLETSGKGVYCYYVELTNSNNKTYILPAKISIEIELEEDVEGRTKSYTNFHIENVYWSNGGYLTFTDDYDNEVYINQSARLTDTHGREYSCKLLNEHAYTDKFQETPPNTFCYFELFGLLFCIIFAWIYSIKLNIRE